MSVEFAAPLRLVPEVNSREHWRKVANRKAQQKLVIGIVGTAALRAWASPPPYVVTITRVGPRGMDDDNVVGSAKHVRDQVAKLLGVDDGDRSKIRFIYDQRKGLPKEYAVHVRIESAA